VHLILFCIITALFPLHTKVCTSSRAPSIKRQTTVKFTGHSRTLFSGTEFPLCRTSVVKHGAPAKNANKTVVIKAIDDIIRET